MQKKEHTNAAVSPVETNRTGSLAYLAKPAVIATVVLSIVYFRSELSELIKNIKIIDNNTTTQSKIVEPEEKELPYVEPIIEKLPTKDSTKEIVIDPCVDGNESFDKKITHGDTLTAGEIPKGVRNLKIILDASSDIELYLFEKNGDKIRTVFCGNQEVSSAGECSNPVLGAIEKKVTTQSGSQTFTQSFGLSGRKVSTDFYGSKIEYSGHYSELTPSIDQRAYNGERGSYEYILIEGVNPKDLILKVYGHQEGQAKVSYSWEKMEEGTCVE